MKKFIAFALLSLTLVGCAANQPRPYTVGGTTLGAGLGALAGQAVGHNSKSTIIGAAAGAAVGAIAGSIQDQTTAISNQNQNYTTQRPSYNTYNTYQGYQTYPTY